MAKTLLNKEDKIVTTGIDDTSKAAGHRFYDIKTHHMTDDTYDFTFHVSYMYVMDIT